MNLDDLHDEVNKLQSLLEGRQTGLMSCNMSLQDRLVRIGKLIESAGVEINMDRRSGVETASMRHEH